MADRGYRKWQRNNTQSGYAGCSIEEQVARGMRNGLDLATVCNRIVYGMIQAGTASDDAMCDILTVRAMKGQGVMGRMMHNPKYLLETYLVANLVPYSDLETAEGEEIGYGGVQVTVWLNQHKGHFQW